ncbi:MAG TPA: TonB family protein [Thermoanaerobaculia bacterium]|nr:TonB family protein [Thermoanaerobaculia bacterium]
MRDGVADVLAQRATLDRGPGAGLLISLLLHGGLTAALVYAATHATAPKPVGIVNIQFAGTPAAATPAAAPRRAEPKRATPAPPVPAPPVETPKAPRIDEPKPLAETKPAVVEKNTVPLSPFGRSTKKGSETPEVAKPAATPAPPAAAPPVPGTTTDVPVGGSGVTGFEGGDFPHTLYIRGMEHRIGTNWFRPQIANGTETVIYFRVQRDGRITDARVEKSSGNATIDRAALSAVRSSTPLQPLPRAYTNEWLGVHKTFR